MAAPYDPVPVKNVSGEDIPSYAVMEPTGDITDGAFEVVKPTADGNRNVLVNGPGAIPAGGYGEAFCAPRVVVALDPEEDEPDPGDELGAVEDSWYLGPVAGGFLILSAGGGRANAVRYGAPSAAVSAWKQPCRAATTASVTLSTALENGDTLDGVTLATGDRILVKDQSSAAENGVYVVNASGAPTRAADADSGGELLGATVVVTNGTTNADTIWLCTTNATITVGSTSLAWSKVYPAAAGSLTYGETVFSAGFTMSAGSSSFQDTGFDIALPAAGTYLVHYHCPGYAKVSALGTGPVSACGMYARLYNETTAAAVAGTKTPILSAQVVDINCEGCADIIRVLTVTGATTLRLEAAWINNGGTYTSGAVGEASPGSQVVASYLKLA